MTDEELNEALEDIEACGYCTLECGCNVEPDGKCCHGNKSPLLELGLI